jgi:hypothetical protein
MPQVRLVPRLCLVNGEKEAPACGGRGGGSLQVAFPAGGWEREEREEWRDPLEMFEKCVLGGEIGVGFGL